MPEFEPPDEQDQSEVFDETHLDDEGDADFLLDEADPVLDITQMDGDADPDDFDEDDTDLDASLGLDGVEARMDSESQLTDEGRVARPVGRGRSEVELVYSGLMENARGAQASAAHWEARSLSDDDIDDLGYGPDQAD